MAKSSNLVKQVEKRWDSLTNTTKKLHTNVLKFTDQIVEDSIDAGGKWQQVMAKGFKGGLQIMEHQQEVVFQAIEGIKEQYQKAGKRATGIIKEEKKSTPKQKKSVGKHDLKLIDGIGPKLEETLNGAGIKTYQDITSKSVEELKAILEKADKRYRLYDPTPWIKQAKELSK